MADRDPREAVEVVDPVAPVEVVVDPDATRAGEAVRARLDANARVAGFVGDADDPALTEFVADVVRPGTST